MSSPTIRRLMLALALVSAVASRSGAEDKPKPEQQTIEGRIEASDHDAQGNVVGVSIFDKERGAVFVAGVDKGRELVRRVGAVVEASGPITQYKKGETVVPVIHVTVYKVLVDEPGAPRDDKSEEIEPQPDPDDTDAGGADQDDNDQNDVDQDDGDGDGDGDGD